MHGRPGANCTRSYNSLCVALPKFLAGRVASSQIAHDASLRWIRHSQGVPGNEMWDYERTRLELFYREALTEAMIDHDRRGRYRQCVKLFEAVNFLQSLFLNSVPDLGTRSRFIRTSNESATAMLHLLQRTPIYGEGWFDTGVAVNTGDLEEFVKFAREKKAEIETLLGIEVRSDLDTKAVQQLGAVLKLIGLKLKRSGSQKNAPVARSNILGTRPGS